MRQWLKKKIQAKKDAHKDHIAAVEKFSKSLPFCWGSSSIHTHRAKKSVYSCQTTYRSVNKNGDIFQGGKNVKKEQISKQKFLYKSWAIIICQKSSSSQDMSRQQKVEHNEPYLNYIFGGSKIIMMAGIICKVIFYTASTDDFSSKSCFLMWSKSLSIGVKWKSDLPQDFFFFM